MNADAVVERPLTIAEIFSTAVATIAAVDYRNRSEGTDLLAAMQRVESS